MPDNPLLSSIGLLSVLDDVPDICFVYRDDGVLMDMNTACETFTGFPRAAVVNRFNLFDNKDGLDPALWRGYQLAFQGQPQRVPASEVRIPAVKENGERIEVQGWVETSLIPLLRRADGTARYILGIQRNITDAIHTRSEIENARDEIRFQRETIASLEAAQREIESQRETIQALTTPVIEVWEGVVTLPLLGSFDEERISRMSQQLLDAVTRTRSRYVILDVTGLAEVDTATGELLLRLIAAVRLLGATGVLVGIQPEIAQSLVQLDVPLRGIRVHQNLREALRACIREQE